jgi:hypothetical protein
MSKATRQSPVAHSTQYRQAQTRHSKTRRRKHCDQRDGGDELLFHPLRSLDYYWLINVYFYFVIYFRTNTIKNILGNALILYSRKNLVIRTKRLRGCMYVCVDTPYMSSRVYASTVPPVVGISYLTWHRYTN